MGLILFVDMDCFFAACEERRHPEVKGTPVIVGTAERNEKYKGVVMTANYEARRFGLKSAMPLMMAYKIKPDVTYFEDDSEYYNKSSQEVMTLLKSHGYRTEVISVDEAALDIGEVDYRKAEGIGRAIKKEINEKLKLPCTIGISTSKIYAKMVCDTAKPNGIGVLKKDDLRLFLNNKDVGRILGVGGKTEKRLNEMGIDKISELAKADPMVLVDKFGSFGKELYLIATGADTSGVDDREYMLSIGRETTLDREKRDLDGIRETLRNLTKEVMKEVKNQQVWFRGVSIKVRYTDLTEHIKNRKLSNYSESEDQLFETGYRLMEPLLEEKEVRKIGIRVYELERRKGQRNLF